MKAGFTRSLKKVGIKGAAGLMEKENSELSYAAFDVLKSLVMAVYCPVRYSPDFPSICHPAFQDREALAGADGNGNCMVSPMLSIAIPFVTARALPDVLHSMTSTPSAVWLCQNEMLQEETMSLDLIISPVYRPALPPFLSRNTSPGGHIRFRERLVLQMGLVEGPGHTPQRHPAPARSCGVCTRGGGRLA